MAEPVAEPVAEPPPEHLELAVGDEHEFQLPGLGTAGYLWQHELHGDTAAIEVAWRRGPDDDGPSAPVGGSSPEIAVVRAVRPGRVALHLVQRRPWEGDAPALHRHRVGIVVTDERSRTAPRRSNPSV